MNACGKEMSEAQLRRKKANVYGVVLNRGVLADIDEHSGCSEPLDCV